MLIDIKNLRVRFNQTNEAVKSISFSIERGKTFCLVGESGSGKSVTAKSIIGLLDKSNATISGQITYHKSETESVDLLTLTNAELSAYRGTEIAMIFQDPMSSLNPVMSCGNQVAELFMYHQKLNKSEAKKQTINLFQKVQLPRPQQLFDAYPHEVSGGQIQRIMIAMALACKPQLLIADEPTTALDVTVQKTILDLLVQLQQEFKMAILFITHDLGVVAEIADEVAVMYQGEIVENKPVITLFSNPEHKYTQALLACRPPLDSKPDRLPTIADFLSEKPIIETETSATSDKKIVLSKEVVLKVSGLSKKYRAKKGWFGFGDQWFDAVKKVDFELFKGESLGLVGESGSGKTTIGQCLVQLTKSSDGKVWFKDQLIDEIADKDLQLFHQKVQLIFQDPLGALNPLITVIDAVVEPILFHGLAKNAKQANTKAAKILHHVGLEPHFHHRLPNELSGGQRQRVVIARALATEPEVIVCDEAVSALDVSIQAQVLNLLNDLKKEFGLTYLFISHDLAVVRFFCDRIIVLNQGEIVEQGLATTVCDKPLEKYTQKLISSIPKGNIESIKLALLNRNSPQL